MASERQIAANRANARKSSGPRSSAGKSRASSNAYRHGLSLSFGPNAPLAPQLETLARKIAGNAVDAITLERAREIAQAEFDLARVRRAKVALIESARACVAADRPPMPPHDPDRSAEAIRRVLPELRKLERYERRAAARRDRAVVNFLVGTEQVQSLVVNGKTKPIFFY